MRSGEHDVARAYVLYRERRASERSVAEPLAGSPLIHVLDGGQRRPLDRAELAGLCADACAGLGSAVDAERVLESAIRNLYDGVPLADVHQALILAARTLIEREPAYNQVTARLLLASLGREVLGVARSLSAIAAVNGEYLPKFIQHGIAAATSAWPPSW